MTPFHLRRRIRARAEKTVRRLWMKYALRGVGQADAHGKLDLAYMVEDPWKLDSEPEHARFRGTSERLARAFGRPTTILEVGCGEGVQSEYFARQCDRLTGIDVSARAIERAKKRLPEAELAAGDLYAMPWANDVDRFDVVVACEVIYYMSDVPRFLDTMSRLGRGCLVTYFAAAERKMGQYVRAIPGVTMDEIQYTGPGAPTSWHVATWTPKR
jgi:2-polyprenyl-3-methyl-5-hydroxy-6-metoxy-1,4-benzoquinol methylase